VRAPKRLVRILAFLKSGQRYERHNEDRMPPLPPPLPPPSKKCPGSTYATGPSGVYELSAMPIIDINPIAVVAPELSPEPNAVVKSCARAKNIGYVIPVDEGRSSQLYAYLGIYLWFWGRRPLLVP
jgi:hypothetical protein